MKASLILSVWLFILLWVTACSDDPIQGCTIPCATNYDPTAEEDDGTCTGCTNIVAVNFCTAGIIDDGSCILRGCTITCANNYDLEAEVDDGSCIGCSNPEATNFCSSSLVDDGSCILPCEANQTGDVFFTNISNTNSTYDIIWDGVKIATVPPGKDSGTFTVAANVQHTLEFRFTNSNNLACTTSTPVIAQCQTLFFNCTG